MTPVPDGGRQPDRLRVGIVGCGGIGNSHARAYVADPRVELVGVVDVIPERAETYAGDYGTTAYGSIAELADQQPDLVHDIAHRTETACPQAHTFEVMRLALQAQRTATTGGFAR